MQFYHSLKNVVTSLLNCFFRPMKPHFYRICKSNCFAVLLVVLILMGGCSLFQVPPSRVSVVTQQDVEQFRHSAHLVLYPLTTKESPELGYEAARLFNAEMEKRNFFKKITLVENAVWLTQLDTDEARTHKALYEAQQMGADLIFLGTIEEYVPATIADTKISLNVKVLSAASGTTVWWGKHSVIGKPLKSYFPLETKLSRNAPSAYKLLAGSAKKIVNKMLPKTDKNNLWNFLK